MALRNVTNRRRHFGDVCSPISHALQQRHQLIQTARRFKIMMRENKRCVCGSMPIRGEKRVGRFEFDVHEGSSHFGGCSQRRQSLFLISIISTPDPRGQPHSYIYLLGATLPMSDDR